MNWKEREAADLNTSFFNHFVGEENRAPMLSSYHEEWKRQRARQDRRVWDPAQRKMVVVPGQNIPYTLRVPAPVDTRIELSEDDPDYGYY